MGYVVVKYSVKEKGIAWKKNISHTFPDNQVKTESMAILALKAIHRNIEELIILEVKKK